MELAAKRPRGGKYKNMSADEQIAAKKTQPGGSAQASEASRDSGVSQPADNEGSRILLVDAGWIRFQTAKHLVKDQRNPEMTILRHSSSS